MKRRCLYCYQELGSEDTDFHPACAKKIFNQSEAPEIPYDESDFEKLAFENLTSKVTLPGVQAKLSLDLKKDFSGADGAKSSKRFTIVNLVGNYILKPATELYPELPEMEDLTMHLARLAKIKVVPHSLIRLKSGKLAYITKRIDRVKNGKLHMEDMCQLTERLTEDKYHGSYEQIAKAIKIYSANPMLDLVNYTELLLFSLITGNADMHLKNFSLIDLPGIGYSMSPAYDLLSTKIINPEDDEDLALSLMGKKKNIKAEHFQTAFESFGLVDKQISNIYKKMSSSLDKWLEFIEISFLSEDFKQQYKELIQKRVKLFT